MVFAKHIHVQKNAVIGRLNRMKIILVIWVGCLIMTAYSMAILRNARIYPPKRVLQGRIKNWGIACALFFFIWLMMLLAR